MTNWLLDAEVLLALVWPRHEGHRAAHVWFAETGRLGWASNTLTELGALRLLTHPAVSKGAVSPADAVRILDAMMAHPAHEFWPLEEMPLKVWGDVLGRIQARRQWTDARLLFEAERGSGDVQRGDEEARRREVGGSSGAAGVRSVRKGPEPAHPGHPGSPTEPIFASCLVVSS